MGIPLLYECDAYNDDLPYWINMNGEGHLIIPYTLDQNDMKFCVVLLTYLNQGSRFRTSRCFLRLSKEHFWHLVWRRLLWSTKDDEYWVALPTGGKTWSCCCSSTISRICFNQGWCLGSYSGANRTSLERNSPILTWYRIYCSDLNEVAINVTWLVSLVS